VTIDRIPLFLGRSRHQGADAAVFCTHWQKADQNKLGDLDFLVH
jgi:hypothetical protein